MYEIFLFLFCIADVFLYQQDIFEIGQKAK